MKLIVKIIIYTMVVAAISSCKNVDGLFPERYEIKKEISFKTALDKVVVYQICKPDSIRYKDIEAYPKLANKQRRDFKVQNWIYYNNIDSAERKRILNIVRESNEYSKNKNLIFLTDLINKNHHIYFSALYSEESKDASGNPTRFYDSMFFIDVKDKKLYKLKHIYDY